MGGGRELGPGPMEGPYYDRELFAMNSHNYSDGELFAMNSHNSHYSMYFSEIRSPDGDCKVRLGRLGGACRMHAHKRKEAREGMAATVPSTAMCLEITRACTVAAICPSHTKFGQSAHSLWNECMQLSPLTLSTPPGQSY